jgi:hypothetical protein
VKGLSAAEIALKELGVSEPNEIDLEAIAWTLGARVRYQPLDRCEARIIGHGDQAIITINSRSLPQRQRFSLAHELGHWRHHRGRLLVCRADEIGQASDGRSSMERIADTYAADILMPCYLFQPLVRTFPRLTFQTVRTLAGTFDTSRTATAIRLVEKGHYPAILICHGPQGRKWFVRSPDVPDRWFPQKELHSDSYAFDILFGQNDDDTVPHKIEADAWFDRQEAARYEVREQTIRTGDEEILTLILIDDEEMLEERDTSGSWRSYR